MESSSSSYSTTLMVESSLLLLFSIHLQIILEYSVVLGASQYLFSTFPTGIKIPLNRVASSALGATRACFTFCDYFPAILQVYRREECAERLRLWIIESGLLLLLFEREIERLHLRLLLLCFGTLLLEGLDLGASLVELERERADVLLKLVCELLELGESGEGLYFGGFVL